MSIRPKQQSPYAQGYADYKLGAMCPFDEGSPDAQEWEVGWMDARRDGVKGNQGIGGTPVGIADMVKELNDEQRCTPVSRAVRGTGTRGDRTNSNLVA